MTAPVAAMSGTTVASRQDYRDLTIQMLAESDAALRDQVGSLDQALQDAVEGKMVFREIAFLAIAMLARVTYERDCAIAARQREKIRR